MKISGTLQSMVYRKYKGRLESKNGSFSEYRASSLAWNVLSLENKNRQLSAKWQM